MKNIEFESNTAQRIYNDYLKRVEKKARVLSQDDKTEILMDINSHIYEGIQRETNVNETDSLLNLIEKLGDPDDFMQPIIAERKINEATRTFNPKTVYQALSFNFKNGIIYSIFSVLYLFLLAFGFLIITKLIIPSKTGLFYYENKFHSFGFVSNNEGMNEILGFWFIPVVLLAAAVFYLIITLLLRLVKKK
ncbi:MAG: hypothetical protein C0598_14030 [Marinilabiliales bacterium]|nr:MAG: hypothetical protein C0598_14030 [Marinilabiliales bacterium]